MSTFDPSVFLSTVFTSPSITERILCPVGEWMGTVDSVDAREWTGKEDPSKKGIAMDILWRIEDSEVKEACKRDKVILRSSVMFSYTEDGLTIDMEKAAADVNFGRLRDAVGLNDTEFAPQMLPGRSAKVRVNHVPFNNPKTGMTELKDEIVAITRL